MIRVRTHERSRGCGSFLPGIQSEKRGAHDDALRQRVAREWSELNGVEITAEMINCSGCRIPGVKTPYCDSLCPIRQCAMGKGLETCSGCREMERCEKLGAITGNNADALKRLKTGI